MPERSRISPMKVKKGMASSVSFIMMPPKMRSGRAWKKVGWNRPSSMPMKPKTMPLAASAKATGKPSRRKKTSEPKMIGAMLAIRNSVTCGLLASIGQPLPRDFAA
jgi:hypothetical protein